MSHRVIARVVAGILLTCCEMPGRANEASDKKLYELIVALGDRSYSRREQATAELVKIGIPATETLEDASRSPDPEVRYRSQRILALVREADFQQRLAQFAADRNPDNDYGLPGWTRFRTEVGGQTAARELFVDMQKSDPQLLKAMVAGDKESREALKARSQEYQAAMRFQFQLNAGSVAALLFVATHGVEKVDGDVSNYVVSFCHQQAFQEALRQGQRQAEMRKILGGFVGRVEGWPAYQAMNLAIQFDIKEGAIAAAKALKTQGLPNQPYLRQQALLTLARFGDESHLPLVETLLEDTSSTGIARRINNTNYVTQIRDIALATLVHLAKQDHKDYGFDTQNIRQAQMVFNPAMLAFPNEEARKAAIAKWHAFRKKNAG